MSYSSSTIDRQQAVLPEYDLIGRGTVIITEKLADQINALHAAHPNNEWSGVLIIEPINDNVTEPDEVVLKALAVYPMDFGSPGYTEYTLDEEVLKIYEIFPDADPALHETPRLKFAQIHTHHTMSAFFSGTDTAELRDNAGKYDYYLSLIVNVSGRYVAKVAFPAELPQNVYITDRKTGDTKIIERPAKKILARFDVDVTFERVSPELDSWFVEKMEELKKAPKKHYTINEHATSMTTYRNYNSTPYGSGNNNYNNATSKPSVHDRDDDDVWSGYGTEYANYQGSKKEVEKEKTKDEETRRTLATNSIDNARLRTALPFLFLEDEEEARAATLFFVIDDHPLKKALPSIISNHVNRIVARIDSWLDNFFGDEIAATNGLIEKPLLEAVVDKVETMNIDNPVAEAFVKALNIYIKERYNG